MSLEQNTQATASSSDASSSFDVIVAGGGMAGVLAAVRIHMLRPEDRILLLEKEADLGGRARSQGGDGRTFGYGLNAISEDLYHFIERTLQEDPDAPDLEDLVGGKLETYGTLQSNKIRMLPITEWYSKRGAKALGGLAAARNWPALEEALAPSDDDSRPFQQVWKNNRKAPVAVVMEHFSSAFGIADLWGASARVLRQRAMLFASPLRAGSWNPAFDALLGRESCRAKITVKRDCMVIDGSREGDEWVLETVQDVYRSQRLVVAQPPWQAMYWLGRDHWPGVLSALGSKTKPTSVVVLTENLDVNNAHAVDLPDITLVPSERVQIINTRQGEICFQATIDFELSLDAPAVLKAVRRVKRARKKLLTLYPDIVSARDHLALQPYAWTQPTAARDVKTVEKLGKKDIQSANLCFVGDAYGSSFNGDENIIASVMSTCESFGAT